jgi:hypothetical protein
VQRLILQSAYFSDRNNSGREAVVVLRSEERQFVGRCQEGPDKNDLSMVALATLEAIKQFLPMPVEFDLKNAAKMQPDPLIKYLFVAKVDMIHNTKRFSLTGACLGLENEAEESIAKATLDATNQLVEHLLEQEEK